VTAALRSALHEREDNEKDKEREERERETVRRMAQRKQYLR
jgi:hypothetical protein